MVVRIVRDGIKAFERRGPGYLLSTAAKAAVERHAAKHEKEILAAFRARTLTKSKFLEGLTDILEAAVSNKAKTSKLWVRKVYKGDYDTDAQGPYAATVERVRRPLQSITASAVQLAMKNKCKTFPWC
jgi:hypothetical protein